MDSQLLVVASTMSKCHTPPAKLDTYPILFKHFMYNLNVRGNRILLSNASRGSKVVQSVKQNVDKSGRDETHDK